MNSSKQNILIIGSGGREHAFAWHISQSTLCGHLFVAPGNAGTAAIATNLPIAVTHFEALANACLAENINLVVVGPEVPLVEGIADYFANRLDTKHIGIIGPSASGARLEGSKDFSKIFMEKYAIPTAAYRTFIAESLAAAESYVSQHSLPVVLKADGLAAGKGVVIATTHDEAIQTLREMLISQKFGEASSKVVVEQYLDGIELSVFVLTDGNSYKILPEAKDYKRIGVGDTGLNTGGMGAVSPVPFADAAFMKKVEETVIQPTINGLKAENIDYKGFIFIGLMNVGGVPYVIEYNVRMGDPETEVVVPRIQSDLVAMFNAVAKQELHLFEYAVSTQTALAVVLAAGGYPEQYKSNLVIEGTKSVENAFVFHAGTKLDDSGQLLTNGGRVIVVSALANSLAEAQEKVFAAANAIQWPQRYFRHDIGQDLKPFLQ